MESRLGTMGIQPGDQGVASRGGSTKAESYKVTADEEACGWKGHAWAWLGAHPMEDGSGQRGDEAGPQTTLVCKALKRTH